MDKRLSIIIPTKNRPKFLERLLSYYAKNTIGAHFLVGDASEGVNRRICEELCWEFGAQYYKCAGKKIGETIKMLSEHVKTPYVTICPDDDILFPSGVAKIINFLDAHKEYHSTNGRVVQAIMAHEYGKIVDLGEYAMGGVYSDTAKERLWEWKCVTLFSIFRTETWKKIWKYSDIFPGGLYDQAFHDEIMPICIGAVLGKTAHIDDVYLLRQEHPRRYVGDEWNVWVKTGKFARAMRQCIDAVYENIPDGDSGKASKAWIRDFFDKRYVTRTMPPKKKRINVPVLKKLKRIYLDIFVRDLTKKKLTEQNDDFRIFRNLAEGGA